MEAPSYDRPLPVPDLDSAPFWEACRRHELRFQRCGDCGAFRFPPNPVCHRCRSRAVEWAESSGKGAVFSWIVVVHPVLPMWRPYVPYAVVLVEMDEGVRMAGNLRGCAPEDIREGMRVEVTFEDVTPEVTLPQFRAA